MPPGDAFLCRGQPLPASIFLKSDKAKQAFNHANNPLRSVSGFFNTIKKLTCINNHIRVMVSRFD
jgi:hypothetical protein